MCRLAGEARVLDRRRPDDRLAHLVARERREQQQASRNPTGEAAQRLRKILVRLSGRQMKVGVEATAPALLAGLEKLLAIDDLLQTEDLPEILALARQSTDISNASLG